MNKLARNCPMIGIFLIGSYAVLFLLNVWTDMFNVEVFFKLSITYLVVAVALLLFYLIFREMKEESENKKDKYIN